MSDSPDPQLAQELATELMLDAAREVDYMGIGERYFDDERCADLDDEQKEALQYAISDFISEATIVVTAPDEQPQDDSFAMVAEGAPAGPPRAVAEYWRDYAAAVSDGGRFADWAQIAQVATWILAAMDAEQPQDDGDVRAVADAVVRLKAWLTGRQANVHSKVSTTNVIAEPRDRSTAAWAIAESDVRSVVVALEARDAKGGE